MSTDETKPGEAQRKIDLNHASRDELMRIPGVSPEAADELIGRRDEQVPRTQHEQSTREERVTRRERAEDELVDRLYI